MYKTSDLYLAAFLKARKHKLSCERQGHKCFFLFTDNVDADIKDFFNDGIISAIQYKNSVQDLKTYIFNNAGDKNGHNNSKQGSGLQLIG